MTQDASLNLDIDDIALIVHALNTYQPANDDEQDRLGDLVQRLQDAIAQTGEDDGADDDAESDDADDADSDSEDQDTAQ